jgi:hypothetical protein
MPDLMVVIENPKQKKRKNGKVDVRPPADYGPRVEHATGDSVREQGEQP